MLVACIGRCMHFNTAIIKEPIFMHCETRSMSKKIGKCVKRLKKRRQEESLKFWDLKWILQMKETKKARHAWSVGALSRRNKILRGKPFYSFGQKWWEDCITNSLLRCFWEKGMATFLCVICRILSSILFIFIVKNGLPGRNTIMTS